MCNKITQICAAIALQEPARLLQHLFHFIAHETTPLCTDAVSGDLQALGQRGKVVRVFDSGDLRVVMKEGSTWTFNPECCTLLSEEPAAAAAAADVDDTVESSSEDEDEDSIQITRM